MKYGIKNSKMLPGGVRLAALLGTGIVLGYLLLACSYLIPQERLMPRLMETIEVFDPATGRQERMDQTLVPGYPSTWLDNTSDSFFLQCAAVAKTDASIWEQAAQNPYYSSAFQNSAGSELIEYVKNGPEHLSEKSMGRYWNGYLIFLKPLLTVMSYQDIRMLNMVVLAVLVAMLIGLMYRRGMQRYLIAFGVAFLSLTPFVLPLNMHYSVVVYLSLTGMIVMLLWPDWCARRLGSTALFFAIGIATAYFDMLTYPILSFGFPAVLWLLLCEDEGEKRAFITLVRIGLAWLAGYALMWASKWIILALAGYTEDAYIALRSIMGRSDSEGIGRMGAIWRNIGTIWRKPFKLLAGAGAVILAALIFLRLKRGERFEEASPMLVLSLLCIAALPFAWYYLLANTNHTHYFFMHRNLSVAVFAVLCLITRMMRRRNGKSVMEVGIEK